MYMEQAVISLSLLWSCAAIGDDICSARVSGSLNASPLSGMLDGER